jgi:hypothetical protein
LDEYSFLPRLGKKMKIVARVASQVERIPGKLADISRRRDVDGAVSDGRTVQSGRSDGSTSL